MDWFSPKNDSVFKKKKAERAEGPRERAKRAVKENTFEYFWNIIFVFLNTFEYFLNIIFFFLKTFEYFLNIILVFLNTFEYFFK